MRRYYSTKAYKNLAFIGLGNMGFPMARNLLQKSKYNISVFDTDPHILQLAAREGARCAKSPVDAAMNSSYVVTMLPGNDQVRGVYKELTDSATIEKESIWIDCSTVDPTVSKEVSQLAEKKGASFLDAPVSGGVTGAAAGSLTFMVGGPVSKFELAKDDVLSWMGKNIAHCGELPGSGEVAKLCNNLILGISMCAVSEAMNLGVKLGVDAKVLSDIINTSSGRCWSSDTYNPYPGINPAVPSSNDYDGGFATSLMLKDLRLALEAAEKSNADTPVGIKVKEVYENLQASGLGNKDFSVIFKYLSSK